MSIKPLVTIVMMATLLQSVFAEPSYEVMKSCQKGSPIKPGIMMTVLNSESGYAEQATPGCENRYEVKYKNRVFGSIECNNDLYIYSSLRKIKTADANDMTSDPKLHPGFFYSDVSTWSKVEDGQSVYLCIAGPLSQASNINQMQYYIVEGVFDDRAPLRAYFYYFGDRK